MPTDESYLSFRRRFDQAYAKLKFPPDCVEHKPPTATNVHLFSWMFDWVLIFNDDNRYLRVRENHGRVEGLALSRRTLFVLHYGLIVQRDSDGNIMRQSGDPVDIRIDNSHGQVHMHYQAPHPHHPQEDVKGLDLESLDMLVFVRAVFQHRKSGKSISETLGFRIR